MAFHYQMFMYKVILYSSLICVTTIKAQKPNVILILADDLGYGDISAFNKESMINTPNIDYLANNGMIFTDAHSSSALSTPSRYSILTGRYSWRTYLKKGAFDGYAKPLIEKERKTIAQMFSKNGYNTACIGKWHLGWNWVYKKDAKNKKSVDYKQPITNGPTERGFDYFWGIPASLDMSPYVYVENDRVVTIPDHIIGKGKGLLLMHGGDAGKGFKPEECLTKIVNHGISYINSQKDSKKPFFLYLPITAPHTPVLPSDEYKGKTKTGPYGDFVIMIDDMIGKITENLKKNGQLENTIIVFTSDNGCAPYIGVKKMESLGHYPSYIYRGYKTDIYEGGHRVPLIVSWQGRYNNDINKSLVSLTDFYATFAQMLGYKLSDDEAVDSYSLWPILMKRKNSVRNDIVFQSGEGRLALRNNKLKLIFYAGSGGWGFPQYNELKGLPHMQLFDINKDVSEVENLIYDKKYETDIRLMVELMRKYVIEGRTTSGPKQHNDTLNKWEQINILYDINK